MVLFYSPAQQSKKMAALRGHISIRLRISPTEKLQIKIQRSETQSSHYFLETLPIIVISTNKKNHMKSYGGTCATQWQSPSLLYTLCSISNRSGETSTHPQVCLWTLERLISTFLFSAVGLHPLMGVYRDVLTTATSRISGFLSWKTETVNEALLRMVWEKGSTPSGWDVGGSVGMCCTILPVMT